MSVRHLPDHWRVPGTFFRYSKLNFSGFYVSFHVIGGVNIGAVKLNWKYLITF
jgi:hypothetical protein